MSERKDHQAEQWTQRPIKPPADKFLQSDEETISIFSKHMHFIKTKSTYYTQHILYNLKGPQ